MGKWSSTQHPISDIRDWKKEGKLEIQPDFQRREVWSEQAKILLIDTILRNIPMPKIFLAQNIKDAKTYRKVIDGQQRITAVLDFLENKFCMARPYKGEHQDKYFRDLDADIQNHILLYQIDFNEISGYTEAEIREMYHRVNKYNVALNKQELRRADFPGEFLKLSESLSSLEFFEESKIFTTANRRRLQDVEYTSELLAVTLKGPQDKKESLDSFYMDYAEWDETHLKKTKKYFHETVDHIKKIFKDYPIKDTRFKQKSDFYSLFSAIHELLLFSKESPKKVFLHEDLLPDLVEDIRCLDCFINPNSNGKFGEYAVKCVSDANSIGSRRWRTDFLKNILAGAYNPLNESQERIQFLVELLTSNDHDVCPPASAECEFCHKEIDEHQKNVVWSFPKGNVFLSTARLNHHSCLKKDGKNYVWMKND